jgi:hypothetical protein
VYLRGAEGSAGDRDGGRAEPRRHFAGASLSSGTGCAMIGGSPLVLRGGVTKYLRDQDAKRVGDPGTYTFGPHQLSLRISVLVTTNLKFGNARTRKSDALTEWSNDLTRKCNEEFSTRSQCTRGAREAYARANTVRLVSCEGSRAFLSDARRPLSPMCFQRFWWSLLSKNRPGILRYFFRFLRDKRGEVTGAFARTSPTHLPPMCLV